MRIIFLIVGFLLKLISNKPIDMRPNNFMSDLQLKSNEKLLFQAFRKDFKPDHYYKIMVHYLGSVRIFFIN
jgi:hypothetical protein